MKQNRIFLLGNYYRSEFISLYHNILSFAQKSSENCCDCSMLFQSYPDEFSQALVNRLIVVNPLAPILLISGSACEGEPRTGRPLNGCFRLYAPQWNDFYQHQLLLHFNGHLSLFSLPRTAENDELTLFQTAVNEVGNIAPTPPNKDCLIVCRRGPLGNDFAMNRLLADFFRQRGFRTRFFDEKTSKSFRGMILADIDDSPFSKILQSVQRLRQDFTDSKIKVCINSPRINEKIDLQQAGVDEILSKPIFW